MKIKLSDHFTYGRLLRFTLPSVVMMVIASIYSVVDGRLSPIWWEIWPCQRSTLSFLSP